MAVRSNDWPPADGAGRLAGKVALVTGAGRGQGRAHAVHMAAEGADVVALDICKPIDSSPYPLADVEDLAETAASIVRLGRRAIALQADVREVSDMRSAAAEAVRVLGGLDIVVANAGIWPAAMGDPRPGDFVDAVDVDLIGVMNTVSACLPHLAAGSSVIVTGSTAAMMPSAADNPIAGPGGAGYGYAKRALVVYTEQLALQVAPDAIRVNTIHPSNVNTGLLHNDGIYQLFRPDLEQPTQQDVEPAFVDLHAMPIPYVEPVDIANLAVYLASDEARYVTGQQIRVDAGSLLKHPHGPGHRR